MDPGVGDQAEYAAVAGHFLNTHLHTRMHRADQHVHLVALDQFVGIFDAFGRLGFVVHLEVFDLAATELAALLIDGQTKSVFNGNA